jgi:hypothetical protein
MIPTQVCNGVDHARRFLELAVAVAKRFAVIVLGAAF